MPKRRSGAAGSTRQLGLFERQAPTAWGEPDGTETAISMERALREENVDEAHRRVVRNGGSAGVDDMSVDDLLPYCQEHWPRIREELFSGRYMPKPVLKVEIDKLDGGGKRTLGIPCVLDRMIQQALLQVLQPVIDPTFSNSSFGFRPGRSAHQAVLQAQSYVKAGYDWVVDLDLEKFFDRVNHDVLMARVARRVKDKPMLLLIRRFLQAGMFEGGLISPRKEGTPQGGPLSPLLSNILLDELDKELEARGHRFVRYADDCNVYVQSQRAGERVMQSLEHFLGKRLRLRINHKKSAVARPYERSFLGYSLTRGQKPDRLRVAPKSIRRLKDRLRKEFRKGRGRKLASTCDTLARTTRGWVAYFKLAETPSNFDVLDKWLRHRLRCILWRQWKNPRTRLRHLRNAGVEPRLAAGLAWSGRGTWPIAATSAVNRAIPNAMLEAHGFQSLLREYQRLRRSI